MNNIHKYTLDAKILDRLDNAIKSVFGGTEARVYLTEYENLILKQNKAVDDVHTRLAMSQQDVKEYEAGLDKFLDQNEAKRRVEVRRRLVHIFDVHYTREGNVSGEITITLNQMEALLAQVDPTMGDEK